MKHTVLESKSYFPLSVQISARARRLYAPPRQAHRRIFALRLLAERLREKSPELQVGAAQLNLLALLNRALRSMAEQYLQRRDCSIGMTEIRVVKQTFRLPALRPTLKSFVSLFPPADGEEAPGDFLDGGEGPDNRGKSLVELYLLATQVENPAARPMFPIFDDGELRSRCSYLATLAELDRHLDEGEPRGPFSGSLRRLLLAPIEACPDSLAGQIAWVKQAWGAFLPPELLIEVLSAFDLLEEEQMQRGAGSGPVPVPAYDAGSEVYHEAEAFSADADWMSNAVQIAKSVHVWLDQLSKRYGRSIVRLDQIPDEELDILARWGFNALWLIGLWERSAASKKIKQIRGNPEAEASAYSLYDYAIAGELGGEEALAALERRCAERGIRLASDVVPNHTGIYSKWTLENPDWFLQLDAPPYPGYRFTGPDLSSSEEIGLYIEDGYYDHSDAAVVFKHVERASGRVRYIYHGNDGTHMPWNDTAQLNYLLPEVREAMIQTIVEVARRFRIIRFDAAMTLAKKHFQRLWFPQPGGGAGVPSRSEHAMSREDFEGAFPKEFWRDVVDRVAEEVPDTLLIAEAFWLMEGYFVRTLGMHRVYNSAFMNMLKQEENAKYRQTIKNILEFNPEILKRFVNFMNNPDEATAVEQFGKGDKYFGVAVLLATMPGLPMFGHGQVEGLEEKYGMEYRRAYWQESVDEAFVRHHESQIFPLLRLRPLFSQAENFVLYDFLENGGINENVFAYSNRNGSARALVAYHNGVGETEGWIRFSAPKTIPGTEEWSSPELAEALAIEAAPGSYWRFRSHRTGMEYLRSSREIAEDGLYLRLETYQYEVFLDFREIRDEDGLWGELHRRLEGRPVADLDRELQRLRCAGLHGALQRAVEEGRVEGVFRASPGDSRLVSLTERLREFYACLARFGEAPTEGAEGVLLDLEALVVLGEIEGGNEAEREAVNRLRSLVGAQPVSGLILPFLILSRLTEAGPEAGPEEMRRDELLLFEALEKVLPDGSVLLLKILLSYRGRPALAVILEDEGVGRYIGLHRHEGTRWFNKERLEELLRSLFFFRALEAAGRSPEEKELLRHLTEIHEETAEHLILAEESGYRLDKFLLLI